MKDYKQFSVDIEKDRELFAGVSQRITELLAENEDKTNREVLSLAARDFGYDFTVLDILTSHSK